MKWILTDCDGWLKCDNIECIDFCGHAIFVRSITGKAYRISLSDEKHYTGNFSGSLEMKKPTWRIEEFHFELTNDPISEKCGKID